MYQLPWRHFMKKMVIG